MSTCACGKPYPGQADGRPWTLPVCGSCFVAVDIVTNAYFYIYYHPTAPPHTGDFEPPITRFISERNPLANNGHVAELLASRPELLRAVEAAGRLGATPTQIRELCTEIEPHMSPSEAELTQGRSPVAEHSDPPSPDQRR